MNPAKRWACVTMLALLFALMVGVPSTPVCLTCPVVEFPLRVDLPECR